MTLDVLGPGEAVRLLASAVGDPRRVTEGSAGVAELAELAGRLPLAIRLIAARLRNRRNWTVEFMSRRLRERAVLEELSTQDINVAAAFGVSYAELDDPEQRMFRLLGLYPGPDFDAEFAAALTGVEPEAADRSLEQLVDAHMLHSDAPGRYRFHDLMRHHAAAVAAAAETPQARDAARRRLYDSVVVWLRDAIALHDAHRSHYPKPVEPVDPPANRWPNQAEAVGWVRAERANLLAMIRDASVHRMDPHCAEMAAALSTHYHRFRLYRETESLARWGLESAVRLADESCEAYFNGKLAVALVALGDLEQAERLRLRVLAIRRRRGESRFVVGLLANRSMMYESLGEWSRVIELLREAVEEAVNGDIADLESIARMMLAYALCQVGVTDEARDQLNRTETRLAETEEDEHLRAQLTKHRGDLRRLEGHPAEARRLHEALLDYFRAQGDVVGTVTVRCEIIHDLIDQRRWDEAESLCHAVMADLRGHEDVIERAELPVLLAEVYLARGEYDEAVEHLMEAEGIARERKATHIVAAALWGMARLSRVTGDDENAIRHAEGALAYFARFDMPQAAAIRGFLAAARP